MKSFKLLAAGLLAASTLVSAFAADLGTVYITGSSAFRASTHNACVALFTSGSVQYGYSGSDITAATYGIFKGTLNDGSGDTATIVTSFNGSAAGIQAIVQTTTGGVSGGPADIPLIGFIDPATTLAANPGVSTGLSNSVTHAADVALSDVRVELTPFMRDSDNVALEAGDSPVGVIQFYWLKNNGASASISNVTHQMVKAAASGSLRLSFFTGNDADTTAVRIVGRNPDSGTRLTAFEEAGYGALTTATQYLPSGATTTTAGSGDITSFSLWPAETVLGIPFAAGNSGYSSGGTLRDVMKRTSSAGPIITYLGRSDAVNAVGGSAVILSYNGVVPETVAPFTSFINGTYPFWSYEHLYYNDVNPSASAVAELLATEIKNNQAGASGIPIATMNVKRSAEGKAIIHK